MRSRRRLRPASQTDNLNLHNPVIPAHAGIQIGPSVIPAKAGIQRGRAREGFPFKVQSERRSPTPTQRFQRSELE